MIVPDASVLLEYLLQTPAGRGLGDRLFAPGETLHAPELIDLEVTQVARRYLIAGEISARRATRLVEDLSDLPLTRYPHTWMLPAIWALHGNLTAYDAAYVVLAEALDAPLLTRDRRLARASGVRARIECL